MKNKIQVATFAMLFLPVFASAATSGISDSGGSYNVTLMSLVGLMLILLFIIGALANTLNQLSRVVRDKIRKDRNDNVGIVKSIVLLLALCGTAFHAVAAETAEKVVAPVSNYIDGIQKNDFYAIMAMIVLELIVIFTLVIYIKKLLRAINYKSETEHATAAAAAQKSWFWDNLNAAVSMDKEKDILLDHNYDGIQELDNALPPWWKYGFYLTIIVACIYLYRYQVSNDGMSQKEEYEAEMKKGEEDKAAYLLKAGNNMDENTVTLLTDPAEIGAGKELFTANCAACHLPDGGGIVGPNLCDDYWLHGGSVKDIFKSIKYGWVDKGMKSWKDDFSPKQIQELTSFVKSLRGTHPASPKAPQGDLYIEAGQKPLPAAGVDSTKK